MPANQDALGMWVSRPEVTDSVAMNKRKHEGAEARYGKKYPHVKMSVQ
jgi:hypothetical protein